MPRLMEQDMRERERGRGEGKENRGEEKDIEEIKEE